jgi:hypothetical protein|tara:strand:- start:24900 stop:25064 length:165 start_codon:yes stop_codon:yes gene_type:complete
MASAGEIALLAMLVSEHLVGNLNSPKINKDRLKWPILIRKAGGRGATDSNVLSY